MRSHLRARAAALLATTIGLNACGGTDIVDNWPTYEVRGTVQRMDGSPVAGALVELSTYDAPDCGVTPLISYSVDVTDQRGRYVAQQDEPAGVLSGCLRLTAHPDTSALSEPVAVADTTVDAVPVIEGQTFFTVDLRLP